jgi:hypothetical protein
VQQNDVDPAANPGALYFVEGHYVTADDALAGNGLNNASYRRITISASFSVLTAGATVREKPAIMAWKEHGLGANQPDPNVQLTSVDVPSDGRFWVAAKASDNGDGTWHYEYAVQNLNSHRSGSSFSVPVPDGATITNIGFHDSFYHSGEPYDNSDWTSSVANGAVTWSSPQTFGQNQNSNALRWSTLYNFRFDADVPPGTGTVSLGLFRPGTPTSVSVDIVAPLVVPCPGDLTGDGLVDLDDLGVLLAAFGVSAAGDLDGDGDTDLSDLGILLAFFGAACE